MKKKLLVPIFVALSATLLSCGQGLTPDNSESEKGDDMRITYEDIYHYDYTKSAVKSGLTIYRASDGYIDNDTQGYNNFYYRVEENGEVFDLVYQDGAFRSDDAYIEGKYMKSTATKRVMRQFISPVTGSAKISTSAFLVEGENPNIIVKVNDDTILQNILTKDGYFNEKTVDLKVGDVVSFIVSGDSKISSNPEINFITGAEKTLHSTIDGHYGDVHPFYNVEEKKMYMYYLSTGRQTGGTRKDTFQSLLSSSSDMIHYSDDELKMDDSARPEQDLYYVLNVFVDADGKYRTYQGMGNHASSAVSDDLHVWRNGLIPYIDEADDLFKYAHAAYNDADVISCRDPDTFWDKDSESYYCVILSYLTNAGANGEKWINLYVGDKEGKFSTKATKLVNMTGRGDSECPQIKKIGNRWYLFYSVYGTGTAGNVGGLTYRIGDPNVLPQNVDWNNKPEHQINGADLHAPQVCSVGDKYYVYGWLNEKYNTSVWGGYLNTPIEVYQAEDGTLCSKIDSKFLELSNKGLIYKAENLSSSVDSFGVFPNSMVEAKLTLETGNSYITVAEGSRIFKVGIESDYSNTYLVVRCDSDNYKVKTPITKTNLYDLKILIDGSFIAACCNDEQVLSAMTALSASSDTIGLVLGQSSSVSNLKINKLANSDNFYF